MRISFLIITIVFFQVSESLAQESSPYRNLIRISISNGLHPLKALHHSTYLANGFQTTGHVALRTEVRSIWIMGKVAYTKEQFHAVDPVMVKQTLDMAMLDIGLFLGFFLNRESRFKPSIYFGGYGSILLEGADEAFEMSFPTYAGNNYFQLNVFMVTGIDVEFPLKHNFAIHTALEGGFASVEDTVADKQFEPRANIQVGIQYVF